MLRILLNLAALFHVAFSSPPFNATTINHFCVVTKDYNATANAYAWLFGTSPPIAKISEHSWLWYRGMNTSAKALLIHVPGGPIGFTLEIISPLDSLPSIYNELLGAQGNSVQHFGINVSPPGSISITVDAFVKQGYEIVFAGQGTW